jgi:CxxC motif-containing protein (DUF1111 family)
MSLLALLACPPGPDLIDPLEGLTLVQEDPSDNPLPGLSEEWMERFVAGDTHFESLFRESQGLGPAFIRGSCNSCHADDARGPGLVRKMVVLEAGVPAEDQSALPFGHTERPYVAGGATQPILPPAGVDLWITQRQPPAVFGRGYLEAVDEAAILEEEAAQAAAGRVSGRVNRVCWDFEHPSDDFHDFQPGDCGLVGRFGLKARVASLDGFAADAYQGDMSITSDYRPLELANPDGLTDDYAPGVDIDPEVVQLTADYMRLLAIPRRTENPGLELFTQVGCADCHSPSLRTRSDYPIADLAGIDAPIFSDLLLHDMGSSDGLVDSEAGPSEWKTAPLIGLRFLKNYLHDGRASTVEEAILAHDLPDSEAAPSVAAFDALSEEQRAELLIYVDSL